MLSYAENPSPHAPLDGGPYIDIYNTNAELNLDDRKKLLLEPHDDHSTEASIEELRDSLQLISGIDIDTMLADDGEGWTAEKMLFAMNETRAFLKSELNQVLGLQGILAEINSCLFYNELTVFSTPELLGYAELFKLDTTQISTQRERDILFRSELEDLIIEFKYWMLERLRLWQWRDEVFFNHAASEFQEYPGASIEPFEPAAQLFMNGPERYYCRVGSITREFLLENYFYFDLCHIAGVLGLGVSKPLILSTASDHVTLCDLILRMVDELPEMDPRHLLTPFGPKLVYNKEPEEKIHNFNPMHPMNNDIAAKRMSLIECAQHAGVSIYVCNDSNSLLDDLVTEKPTYSLAEEIIAQYLSPQFFSGVEGHRDYLESVTSYRSLTGKLINEYQEGELLFYGVGNGTSSYRIYEWSDLENVFASTLDYIDPWSISEHPENPELWSRFSEQSIRRLRKTVLPRLHVLYQSKPHIYDAILRLEVTLRKIDQKREKIAMKIDDHKENYAYLYQSQLVKKLRAQCTFDVENDSTEVIEKKKDCYRGMVDFFATIYNIGSQFSDWDENFTQNSTDKDMYQERLAIGDMEKYNYLRGDQSYDMHDKVMMMLTYEIEQYINIVGPGGNISKHLKELRLVRFFDDRYCVGYQDELESLGGRIYLMTEALHLGYFEFLQTSGNWLMSSAIYYAKLILEESPMTQLIRMEI